jgi:2-(1,2-epoxy-1,2-dihydrophenyl)acetyl-CoA isomerase
VFYKALENSAMNDDLLESIDGGIATLTLNRPAARNALTPRMMIGLREALPRLAADTTVRVVVLTGAGNAFCAGGDVKRFAEVSDSDPSKKTFDEKVHDLRSRMEVSRVLHEMPKPTLAVIPGAAAGAGLSLALACDLRIAVDNAKLTTAFSRIGLSGDFGGSYFMTYLVGVAMARELYFTGKVLSGSEAHEIGLVNRVVTADALPGAAKDYASELSALPTIALGYMKRNLNVAVRGVLSDVLDSEAIHMIRTFETDDHKAAAKAFVEKQKPEFRGR